MAQNWIEAENFSFNSILLMDRWILRYLAGMGQSGVGYYANPEYRMHLGIALAYNPAVHWYFENKCPEAKDRVTSLVDNAPENLTVKTFLCSSVITPLSAHCLSETFLFRIGTFHFRIDIHST